MATCRCKIHQPTNEQHHYLHYACPVGYPNTSSICGRINCNDVGYIFLTEDEVKLFYDGQRIFEFPTQAEKVAVEGTLYSRFE